MRGQEMLGLGIGAAFFVCWGLAFLVGIFFFVVWILMLIDCIKRKENEFPEGGENAKTIWLIVLIATWAVGFSWLAAILYYFMVVRKAPRAV